MSDYNVPTSSKEVINGFKEIYDVENVSNREIKFALLLKVSSEVGRSNYIQIFGVII